MCEHGWAVFAQAEQKTFNTNLKRVDPESEVACRYEQAQLL